MLSKMFIQILSMLLVFVSAVFATAPDWVVEDVVLDYSVDSDTVTFTVLERTSTEIKIQIGEDNMATENASAIYGQFWFDDSLLADASKGDDINEFEVTAEGTQTFAGKQWDTITLEATLSGAKTTRVYDKESGVMLKQTVQVTGAPTVTLTEYTFSEDEEPETAEEEPATESTDDTTSEPTTPESSEQEETEEITPPEQPTVEEDVPAHEETTKEKVKPPCCPASVLLLLLLFIFIETPKEF